MRLALRSIQARVWIRLAAATVLRAVCPVEPLTSEIHDPGRRIAERYQPGVYDAMIVAAVLLAGRETLHSEDMHNGQLIDRQSRICNPFAL